MKEDKNYTLPKFVEEVNIHLTSHFPALQSTREEYRNPVPIRRVEEPIRIVSIQIQNGLC